MSNRPNLRLDAVDLALCSSRGATVVACDLRVFLRSKRAQPRLEAMKFSVAMHRLSGRNGTDSEQSNGRCRGGDETRCHSEHVVFSPVMWSGLAGYRR